MTRGSDALRPDASRAIREVSELLGIPAPTLRSWERRYGIPTTGRSVGGHRRYSAEAMHELRLMRDEIARGTQASAAARVVRALLDPSDPQLPHIHSLLAASRRMDAAQFREELTRAHDELGLAPVIDEVLMPTMRQVGIFWESGRCDVSQEHLTTEAARAWLSWITSLAPAPGPERPILLACGPHDLHTLGLEALAALLAHRRRSSRVLGARTPGRSLVTALTATDAAAAVVVSHLPTQRRSAVEALREAAGTGASVFYAGNAFVMPAARAGVPGIYLGAKLGEATNRILEIAVA